MTRIEDRATRLDHVIDSLIHGTAPTSGPVEDELADTARLLRNALPRLHPRFTFEEHLAARLAAARRPQASSAGATVVQPLRSAPLETTTLTEDGPVLAERRRRTLVAGGAIASGVSLALPIAGVALVAWRRSRSSGGLF